MKQEKKNGNDFHVFTRWELCNKHGTGIYNQSFSFFIYFAPFLMFLDGLESS